MRLISPSLNFLVAGLLAASGGVMMSTSSTLSDEQGEFKDKFKAGCESTTSPGSFIEAPDGQYRCNHHSGDVTKCFPDTPPHQCEHINTEGAL